jgi:predicted Zn-dependent protease
MVKTDLGVANRQRVKVIEATPDDTFKSLAARSQLKNVQELRLINGDYPNGEPRAGDLIKIVQ